MEPKAVAPMKQNVGFLYWLLKLITFPCSIYKFLFTKDVRNSMNNKVVLITGASSGLGEAMAHVFYTAGCKLILAARRKEELERVKKDLLDIHSTSVTHIPVVLPLDLTDLNSLPEKINHVLGIFGYIDVLVNNGGISLRETAINTSIDVDIKIMLTNYFGTVALTKAVLPSMIKRKSGRIVCIGSIQGKCAIPHRASYSASKHALQAFCDSVRAEMDEHNVKVTLISPGWISTNLSLNALTGNGTNYGKMDDATAQGADPIELAHEIVRAILADKKDVISASLSPRLAVFIRAWWPALYFWIMAKRAHKLSQQANKQD